MTARSQKRRVTTAEDLYRFQMLTDAQISPEGEHIVYAIQRVDRKTEKKYSNLWIVPSSEGEARQLTWGDQSDRAPHAGRRMVSRSSFYRTGKPKDNRSFILFLSRVVRHDQSPISAANSEETNGHPTERRLSSPSARRTKRRLSAKRTNKKRNWAL